MADRYRVVKQNGNHEQVEIHERNEVPLDDIGNTRSERVVVDRRPTTIVEEAPYYEHEEVTRRDTSILPWSPAQIGALVAGIGLVIVGGMVLARVGFSDLQAETQVLGLAHTPALGLLEIAAGALLLIAGAIPGASRGLMSFVGAALLVFGVVIGVQPDTFSETLATTEAHGWTFGILGALLLILAMVSPVIWGGSSRRYRRTR